MSNFKDSNGRQIANTYHFDPRKAKLLSTPMILGSCHLSRLNYQNYLSLNYQKLAKSSALTYLQILIVAIFSQTDPLKCF